MIPLHSLVASFEEYSRIGLADYLYFSYTFAGSSPLSSLNIIGQPIVPLPMNETLV